MSLLAVGARLAGSPLVRQGLGFLMKHGQRQVAKLLPKAAQFFAFEPSNPTLSKMMNFGKGVLKTHGEKAFESAFNKVGDMVNKRTNGVAHKVGIDEKLGTSFMRFQKEAMDKMNGREAPQTSQAQENPPPDSNDNMMKTN